RPTVLTRIARFATRRPIVILIIAASLIGLSALPFLRVKFTTFDFHALPDGSSSRIVAEALTNNFNVQTAPITVLYTTPQPLSTARSVAEIQGLTQQLLALETVDSAATPTPIAVPLKQLQAAYVSDIVPTELALLQQQTVIDDTVLLTIYPTHNPTDQRTQDLIVAIRGLSTENNSSLQVGGMAAIFYDTMRSTAHYLPYSLGIIVISMFILLTLMLRSIVIPLQAILINSLALLVAFGVLVLIFQDGYLTEGWLSYTGGLDVTIPILIFAVAFGLSMDYAAFLYSRMREIYDKTGDPHQAIIEGVHHTGPIITAAAGALFIVVIAFASSKIAMLQQVGIGLAVAVLVDAFLVRLFLVPAVMQLFGHTSWYAPKWIRRWQIRHD
ncbi:MMPL family transporter, partial [Pedobacter sp.]|nr:MMPL family transporter [Candidatus Saccharibacteria bacterium]